MRSDIPGACLISGIFYPLDCNLPLWLIQKHPAMHLFIKLVLHLFLGQGGQQFFIAAGTAVIVSQGLGYLRAAMAYCMLPQSGTSSYSHK